MNIFTKINKPSQNTRKKVEKQPKLWLKPARNIFVVMLLLLGTVLGSMKLNEQLSVSYWDIEAPAPLQRQIEAFFTQQSDRSFWSTRASVIQTALLLAIPDIKEVAVSRILPDGLQVSVVERKPVALWENTASLVAEKVFLVDGQGQAYRGLRAGEAADLPLLRVSDADLVPAIYMLHDLAKYQYKRMASLSEVIVKNKHWRLNFAHGEQWLLQQASLKEDMNKMMSLLEQPRWNKGYWRMDARIPQRWFVRPAKREVI
ncbi:MAG: FtsQ-type POTRA domain-containing protein [Ghiorsea sp.]